MPFWVVELERVLLNPPPPFCFPVKRLERNKVSLRGGGVRGKPSREWGWNVGGEQRKKGRGSRSEGENERDRKRNGATRRREGNGVLISV